MARQRSVISPEEGAEMERLKTELAILDQRILVILARKDGMNSPEFFDADKAKGSILRRMHEILG
jgi:hypothetical protein